MGEWRTLTVDWGRPNAAVACRLCGRPLFGRAWSAEAEGERADFCDPAASGSSASTGCRGTAATG